jgi:hypothetical protein
MDFFYWDNVIKVDQEDSSTVAPPTVPLPPLRLSSSEEKRFTPEQVKAFAWIIEQCDCIQSLL